MSPAIRFVSLLMVAPLLRGDAQPITSSHFRIEQLAPGVYVAVATDNGHAGANAGIVNLGDKTVIFDTFLSPIAARDLLRAAEQLTHNPVAYVVNSHFHNDHVRGNQVFSPGAIIISTARTREAIRRIEPEQIKWEIQNVPQLLIDKQESLEEESDPFKRRDLTLQLAYLRAVLESHSQLRTRLPDQTFEDKLTLYGTTRFVQLLIAGSGHTPGDCIMLLPDEHIAFVGDLVTNGMHPYMPDGSPEEWKATLQKLESLPIGTIVPGHGSTGHRAIIDVMIDYVQQLQTLANEMATRGKSEEDVQNVPIPLLFQSWLSTQYFFQNLTFLYNQGVAPRR